MTATTTSDTARIELRYPQSAERTLRLRIGPCHLRFTPTAGPMWISGTYADPTHTLPIDVRTDGPVATIAQRIDLRALGRIQLPQLDFCGLARSQGVQAVSVTSVEQLDDALLAAFNSDGPMLVEVAVEQAS